MFVSPAIRKVFEGVASRHEMYALFNRHAQAPFDDDRMNGTRYVGEWFEITEADHDHMFEILPPLFYRGDMFAMREFLAANVTSVFFALTIDDRSRWFHGYCDLGDRQSPDRMRAEIIVRESRPVRAMNRQEKLDHIWSATGPDFRGYADARFPADLRNRQIVLVYTCVPIGDDLETSLNAAISQLPTDIYDGDVALIDFALEDEVAEATAERPDDRQVREGSYFIGKATALMQVVDGVAVPAEVRKGRSTNGIFAKHALIIRKLIPIRDAVRLILKLQERDQPWQKAQVALRIAWSSFVREFGPINFTSVSTSEDPETGEVREVHRRPNLAPFLDDPDCWLVASIEDYDLETNTAKPGPIFTERVIAPPPAPVITSALDALAVVLNERGHVDPDHIAELLHRDVEDVIGELGEAIYRDPSDGSWQMADAYLSGAVRSKLTVARAAAELDPAFAGNVSALARVQPADLRPSDITARLGAPWISADDVVAFVKQMMEADILSSRLVGPRELEVGSRLAEFDIEGPGQSQIKHQSISCVILHPVISLVSLIRR